MAEGEGLVYEYTYTHPCTVEWKGTSVQCTAGKLLNMFSSVPVL